MDGWSVVTGAVKLNCNLGEGPRPHMMSEGLRDRKDLTAEMSVEEPAIISRLEEIAASEMACCLVRRSVSFDGVRARAIAG